MTTPAFPAAPVAGAAPADLRDAASRTWVRRIADAANNAIAGKLNATTTVTLAVNATSTTITDPRIDVFSVILLSPQTQSAAQSQVMGIWIVPGVGSAVINHVSYDAVDQTFGMAIFG